MSVEVGTAYLPIEGDFGPLNKAVANLGPKLNAKFGKVGKVAGLGLGVALVGGFAAGKALYDIGAEFDDAFDKIRIKTGKTGKQLGRLKGDFKNVVSSVPAEFNDAAAAIGGLNQRLGLTGKPLRKLSKQMLELSRITETDVGENVQTVTRLFGDWSIKTGQQGKTLDKLFRVSQATGVGVSELSDEMVQFGSPLRQLGFNFDTAAAMFAKFEKEGVNLQTLMPGLRMALKNLANPTDELAGKLKDLGIAGKEPDEKLREVIDTIAKAKTVSGATDLAASVFGGRAWSDAAAAIQEGRFNFKALIQTMEHGNDTIRKAGKGTMDTEESLQLLGNKLKVLVEPAATAVFKAVGKLADRLSRLNFKQLAHALGTSQQDLKEFGQNVATIFSKISPVVGEALGHAADFLKNFGGVLRGIVKVIGSVLRGEWGKAWQGVKQTTGSALKATLALILGITTPIRLIGGKIGGALSDAFSAAWRGAKSVFRDGVNGVIDLLNTMVGLINKLPFVELGEIGHVGAGGGRKGSTKLHQQHRAAGGFIVPGYGSGDIVDAALPPGSFVMNKKATEHYGLREGGLMPVKLEPRERVFLPPEVRAIGQSRLQSLNDSVPRFGFGGLLEDAAGAVAGAARSVAGMGLGAILDKLPSPSAVLPGWLAGFGDYLKGKLIDWVKGESAQAAGPTGGERGPKGVGSYKGVPMANWVIQALQYAASKGAAPQPTSGYRSHAQNVAEGRLYFSEHEKTQYPGGAVDFGSYTSGLAAKMSVVNATKDFKYPLLAPIGFRDDGHASGTGHQLGGLVGAIQKLVSGGWVKTGYTTYDIDGPGAYGDLMKGKGYAELGSATEGGSGTGTGFIAKALGMSGELPKDFPLEVKIGSKMATLYKRDRGYGQGDPYYSIDIHHLAWPEVGLSGNSKGNAFIKPADGSGKLSEGQQKAAEGKRRKAGYESTLAKLRQRVAGSKTDPAKQSALWKLMKFWGRVGIFDKGERSHILDAVQEAASKMDPGGTAKILGNLAGFAKGHGEITGQDPDNWHSMTDAIEKAQERGKKQRERTVEKHKRQRERKKARIAARGNFADLAAALEQHEGAYNQANQGAERLVALEPEDVTDDYVGQERGAPARLAAWRDKTVTSRDYASFAMQRFQWEIDGIKAFQVPGSKRFMAVFQKNKWKIPALREAITNAQQFISDRRENLQDFQGFGGPEGTLGGLGEGTPWWLNLGGPGTRIFDTQNTIRELGIRDAGGEPEKDTERASLLEQLLREANQRTAVSDAQKVTLEGWDEMRQGLLAGLPKAHDGATVLGPPSKEVAVMVRGGETILPEEPVVVGSGEAGGEIKVVVNGDIVQEKGDRRDPVEVVLGDRRFVPAVQKAARGGRPMGILTSGGAR